MNDEIIRDVEEAMKQEKLSQFWETYGTAIIAVILAVIIGAGAYSGYNHYKTSTEQQQTTEALEASILQESEPQTIEQKIEDLEGVVENLKGRLKIIMSFQLANTLIDAGRYDAALAIFDEIAEARYTPEDFRDIAVLSTVRLRMDRGAETETLIGALKPLTKEGRPIRYSAMEMLAILHHQSGEFEKGNQLLDKLAQDQNAPQSIKERAPSLKVAVKTATEG